jgi:tetratricopeptide (TPR) repeat protein
MLKALLLVALLSSSAWSQNDVNLVVSGHNNNGEALVSVNAKSMRVSAVVEAIAAEFGLTVSGFAPNTIHPLVTATLKDRPLDSAVEIVLGSSGLTYERTGNTIFVHEYSPGDREELLMSAKIAYAHAVRAFPENEMAPSAHLSQGWVEEQYGNFSTAISMYEIIPEKYPLYKEVAAAYFHIARLNEELGNWRDAIQSYDSLENLRTEHEFHSAQRLGRARCDVELGNPRAAIYKIEVLNMERRTSDPEERTARLMVHARANNGLREYGSALRDLDVIAQLDSPLVATPEYLQATAISLEGLGMFGPAAQAWLAYAHKVDGQKRLIAVEMAVELYLDEDDEVSAIHALRFGKEVGLSAKLTSLQLQIDERLGLNVKQENQVDDPTKRLERAQVAWDGGDAIGAYREISALTDRHGDFAESTRIQLYSLWARCTASIEGMPAAVGLMRELRNNLDALENRSALDLVAAELYEAAGLFDEAVDSYGGIYR